MCWLVSLHKVSTVPYLQKQSSCWQPEPGADYQGARAGEVVDYESGLESAEPIKHDSVTRAAGTILGALIRSCRVRLWQRQSG